MVLTCTLVVENALTATMKRQIKLNEERLYSVVMQYHEDVVNSKSEKVLILWLSILCKLTNDETACTNIIDFLYQTLYGLLRENYYNEAIFEKIYVEYTYLEPNDQRPDDVS